jgi:hypothetical protein
MPLSEEEWTLVRELVIEHLVGVDNPYPVLRTYFPDEAGDWPLLETRAQYADMIVQRAKIADLAQERPLSIELLMVLRRQPTIGVLPAVTKLTSYLKRLSTEKAALDSDDPFAAHITSSGEVFINRQQVRSTIRLLVDPPPDIPEPLVLRVTGERQAGTSYTFSLLQHLSAKCRIYPVRIGVDATTTAADVVRDVAVRIEPGLQPEPVDDPTKRLRYWALWLVEQARRVPHRPWWWFVFDQCNELDPGSDVVELIGQLAIAIKETTPAPGERRPRLILLGYDDTLAEIPLPPKQIHPDDVRRATEADVRTFFTRYLTAAAGRTPSAAQIDQEQIDLHLSVVVEEVLDAARSAEARGDSYMAALRRAAEGAIDVLAA